MASLAKIVQHVKHCVKAVAENVINLEHEINFKQVERSDVNIYVMQSEVDVVTSIVERISIKLELMVKSSSSIDINYAGVIKHEHNEVIVRNVGAKLQSDVEKLAVNSVNSVNLQRSVNKRVKNSKELANCEQQIDSEPESELTKELVSNNLINKLVTNENDVTDVIA